MNRKDQAPERDKHITEIVTASEGSQSQAIVMPPEERKSNEWGRENHREMAREMLQMTARKVDNTEEQDEFMTDMAGLPFPPKPPTIGLEPWDAQKDAREAPRAASTVGVRIGSH